MSKWYIAPAAWALMVVAVCSAFLLPELAAARVFDIGSFYIMTGLVAWSVFLLFPHRHRISGALQENRLGVALAAVLALWLLATVKAEYRTLSDETNIISAANVLLSERHPRNSYMGFHYFGSYHSIASYNDKRPVLYSYSIQLLHLILGRDPQNAFRVNLLVYFALLFSIFSLIRPRLGPVLASASCLFVAGQANVLFAAASASMDLLSLYLFLAVLWALYEFLKGPTETKLWGLWTVALFFSYSRYESIGLAMLLYLGIWLGRAVPKRLLRDYSLSVVLASALLFPLICQQSLSLGAHENPDGVALFSWEHLLTNCGALLTAAFNFNQPLPFSGVLSIALVLGAGLAVIVLVRRPPARELRLFYGLSVLTFLVHLGLMLSHLGSAATHPNSARFYLPLSLAAALAPAALWSYLPRIPPLAFLMTALVNLVIFHSIAMENRFGHALVRNREAKQVLEFLKTQPDRDMVVIYEAPGILTAHDYSAVTFGLLLKQAGALDEVLKNASWNRVYAVQTIEADTNRPLEKHQLPKIARLKTVAEFAATDKTFTRISQVF